MKTSKPHIFPIISTKHREKIYRQYKSIQQSKQQSIPSHEIHTIELICEETNVKPQQLLYQRLPFASSIPLSTAQSQQLLKTCTIADQFPNYYISSLPELEPTIPYILPSTIDFSALFTNQRRVGSNSSNTNGFKLYHRIGMDDDARSRLHPSVSPSKFNAKTTLKDGEQIPYAMGLIATEHIPANTMLTVILPDGKIDGRASFRTQPDVEEELSKAYAETVKNAPPYFQSVADVLKRIRFELGTMPIFPDSFFYEEAASFALCLVFNRIHNFSYYDILIDTLPENDISTSIYDPNSLQFQFHIPTSNDLLTQPKAAFERIKSHLINLSPKEMGFQPMTITGSKGTFGKSQKLDVFDMIDMASQLIHKKDPPVTRDSIEKYFEWAFYTIINRWINPTPQLANCVQEPILKQREDSAYRQSGCFIPFISEFMQYSHNPNCNYLTANELQIHQKLGAAWFVYPLYFGFTAIRDIRPGEQITLPFPNSIPIQPITKITSKNQIEIATKLRQTFDLKDLFHTSLARVPHAIEHLKSGFYTTSGDKRYNMYTQFFAGDEITFANLPTLSNIVLNWAPPFEYLTSNFQSTQCNSHVLPKSLAQIYNTQPPPAQVFIEGSKRHYTGTDINQVREIIKPANPLDLDLFHQKVVQDEIIFDQPRVQLSYHDAPLKYIFPCSIIDLDPRYIQLIKKVMKSFNFMNNLKMNWFGPTDELILYCRLLAIPCFEALAPEIERTVLISQLPIEQRNKIDNIDLYEITPQQSTNYIIDKIKQRTTHVMDIIDQRLLNTSDPILGPRTIDFIAALNHKIDDQNEYGMIIQLFFMAQQYQNIASSPIPIHHYFKTDEPNQNGATKVYEPPTLQSTIIDYQKALMINDYDAALTNIRQYHHYSLISHINKVLATRLGLHVSTKLETNANTKSNDQNPDNNQPSISLSQEWYRCDGYVKPSEFNSIFRLNAIPTTSVTVGKFTHIISSSPSTVE